MDENLINKVLRSYKLETSGITPIKTGKFNSSFIIDLEGDSVYPHDKLILRIAPAHGTNFIFYEKNMMQREVEVINKVREYTQIPVPEVFIFDDSNQVIDREFMLMEWVPGKPLSNAQLNNQISATVMQKAGEYLRELHKKCRSDSYGYPQIMASLPSWPQAFTYLWENLINDIQLCGVYSFTEAQQVKKALQSQIEHFNHLTQSSLLHMDIWSQNIIVDYQGNLAAIIDWDRALWGDPEIEYAVLDYCGFNNSDFWNGYGSEPSNDESARIRGIFYHFYEVQKYLVIWTLRRPDPVGVGSYKKYALDTLRKYL